MRIVAVCAAFTIAYLFERWLDLGVIAALVIGAAALLALACGASDRVLAEVAVLMPFAGLFHIDPQWRRVTIGLYLGYLALVVVTAVIRRHRLRRKSTAGGA